MFIFLSVTRIGQPVGLDPNAPRRIPERQEEPRP
jgi:hypothetical protein